MKNKQTTWLTKMIAILFLSPLAIGFTSCGEKEVEPTETIMQIVNSTNQVGTNANTGLDSLAKYLNVYPDLVATLGGSGNFTLFAPTNQAFINLLATPGFPQNIADINPDVIKGVLQYHVLASQVLSSELTPSGSGQGFGTTFSATNPCSGTQTQEYIKINDNRTLLTGSTNVAIVIREADLKATNGVVHIVETVLIQPSVGNSLTPILGRLAGTVLLGANFTEMAKLITEVDCAAQGDTPKIAEILTTQNLTLFLPPNQVLGSTNAQALLATLSVDQKRAILLNHLTNNGVVYTLVGGPDLPPALPASFTSRIGLTINNIPSDQSPSGKVLMVQGTQTAVPIVFPASSGANNPFANGLQNANGRVHLIGGILLPPAPPAE